MNIERLNELTNILNQQKVNIATIQGTQWTREQDLHMNHYNVYMIPAGTEGPDKATGCLILTHENV